MREEELEDGSGVPMSGVSRRVVTRVEHSRVPDIVGVHPLRSRLNCSALVPCPPRLSVVPRATVDGLSVHQVAPHWLALALWSLSSGGQRPRQARHYSRVRYDGGWPLYSRYPSFIWRVELVFVTALVSVILTELSAAETQPHGPYTFRNARLELFQTGIGSTGLRYCCRKFCKNDEDKIMTKTSSTLHI